MATKRKPVSQATPKPCRCRRFVTQAALEANVRSIRARGDDPCVWPFFAMATCHHIVEDTTLVHATVDVSHLNIDTAGEVFTFVAFALLNTCTELQEVIEMMEQASPDFAQRTPAIREIKAMNTMVARACETAKQAGVTDEFRQTAYAAALKLEAEIGKMKLRQTILFLRKGQPPFAVVRSAMLVVLGRPDASAPRVARDERAQ